MKRNILCLLCVVLLDLGGLLPAQTLWFQQPATDWNHALPVGNGRLGSMVFGGVSEDRLQLNEETVWTHVQENPDAEGGYKYISKIRELLFLGEYAAAEQLCAEHLLSQCDKQNSYQSLGDISLTFNNIKNYSNYRNQLDLATATVSTTFNAQGVNHTRTVFSSAPAQALFYKAQADKSGQIFCTIQLSRPSEFEKVVLQASSATKGVIIMTEHIGEGHGVCYETRLTVTLKGGELKVQDGFMVVEGADEMLLRLVAATDYRGDQPAKKCAEYEALSDSLPFERIYEDHIKEYQSYFNRVSLQLPVTSASLFATDDRIEAQKREAFDPDLYALYFQFGRYLLISSSRPGCLPANLQGLWADGLTPPWNADYHVNINIQMNYWPAEITNLSECHLPFLDFIGNLRENGRKTAKELYGVNGFTCHHTTDAWHFTTANGKPEWGMWPMGAAWSATHIWEHYLYTGDIEYLKNYGYKVMREAAQFLSESMVKNPKTRQWVTGPSMSPENVFVTSSGDRASVCMGPSMDLQIVHHLFTACIEASTLLNTDSDFRKKLQNQLDNLTPVGIGADGRILEWSDESLQEAYPGHRHMSHLYGLYPSGQYNWSQTPQYMEAASEVLIDRLKHGGGHTGWSRAWIINFYARLLDGDKAWSNLNALLAHSTLPNMFDNHPPFQIDGNFGATAGIAELLLQSHTGEVAILPALPQDWDHGAVKGLCARGGFVVDIEWSAEGSVSVSALSNLGGELKLKYKDQLKTFQTTVGERIDVVF